MMNADELIESYVSDVVKRLPRKQRVDVALELRSLLAEELGPDAEPERARELLRTFGRPAEVAARYRPTLHVIDPADARTFRRVSLIGVAVVWLLGVIDVALDAGTVPAAQLVPRWWFNAGLAALWWPGFLGACFVAAAWVRRRWPRLAEWKPRAVDRDQVNRVAYAAGGAAAVLGTVVLAVPSLLLDAVWGGRAAPEAYAALAYDDGFARTLGPVVLVVLGANIALLVALAVRGRWQPLTRRLDLGLTVVTCAVLTWVLVAARPFESDPANETVRLALLLIIVVSLIGAAYKVRNLRLRSAITTHP
ncbi:putative membrane protein [Allocatelliglobosispora scoriae]|uniref:Putative membrane protein n=1 Tax=Allocatelliglobosispora scoriae TaxID=643052 RepID=A0A841C240_9ACTN|nr:hypothetical protein [Allocatelliglobosispora scoriae]MBB5872931.1 putative membrane protein [Allocatelliglobosispora scoriae]